MNISSDRSQFNLPVEIPQPSPTLKSLICFNNFIQNGSEITIDQLDESIQLIALNPQLREELEKIIGGEEQLIESGLARLEQCNKILIDSDLKSDKSNFGSSLDRLEALIKEQEFLEAVLPKNILIHPSFKKMVDQDLSKFAWGDSLLTATESGFTGLAFIYKSKILKEGEKLLKQVKSHYSPATIPANIHEWEIHLKQKRVQFEEELQTYQTTIAGRAASWTKFVIDFSFAPQTLSATSQVTLGILGSVGSLLGVIVAGLNLKNAKNGEKVYKIWVEQFKKWEERVQEGGTIAVQGVHLKKAKSIQEILRQQAVSKKDYEGVLNALIGSNSSLEKIQSYLKTFNFVLPESIKTKQQFVKAWQDNNRIGSHSHAIPLKKQIVDALQKHHETLMKLNEVIEKPKNLLEKREAIVEKKLLQLRPQFDQLRSQLLDLKKKQLFNQIKHIFDEASNHSISVKHVKHRLQEELGIRLPNHVSTKRRMMDLLISNTDKGLQPTSFFDRWFARQKFDSDTLLKNYIDHQEVLEKTSRGALQQMVNKKHELENTFIQFKSSSSKLLFKALTIAFIASSVLGLIGLAMTPVGGIGMILILISVATTTLNIGSIVAGFRLSNQLRSNTGPGFFLNIKFLFNSLYKSIKEYQFYTSQNKLLARTKMLYQFYQKKINDPSPANLKKYESTLKEYKDARKLMKVNQQKYEGWKESVRKIEIQLQDNAWKDFASYSKLKTRNTEAQNASSEHSLQRIQDFDSLNSLEEILGELDSSLMDPQTRSFLETQLGINLKVLQNKTKTNNDAIKQALQYFFSLNESRFINFMQQQEDRQKKGLIFEA